VRVKGLRNRMTSKHRPTDTLFPRQLLTNFPPRPVSPITQAYKEIV